MRIFPKKIPSLYQLKLFPTILNKKERVAFFVALSFLLISLVSLPIYGYLRLERVPASGGKYIEGIVGSPRFINPIYSPASDVDRDISSIVFSGIINHDKSLNIAEEIIEDGRNYNIKIKENLKWSDGEPITADDIIFTIKAIQDPDYRSPLRPDWVGIKTKKISDLEINIILEQESSVFINKLTLMPIPSHIWKDISPQSFHLSRYNLEPISSGPYKINEIKEDREGLVSGLTLNINDHYHNKKPYIEEISFVFFENKEKMITAAKKKQIQGLSIINPKDYESLIDATGFNEYKFQIPRYFALFFNNDVLVEEKLRNALSLATDKDALIESVLSGRGEKINSPVNGLKLESTTNIDKSSEILDSIGWIKGDDGFRSEIIRDNMSVSFSKNINVGASGKDVRNLQHCLMFLSEEDKDIFFDGNVTGFYNQETRDAVTNFQERYDKEILIPGGFTKGTGMVGPGTRKKLNELCSEIPMKTKEIKLTIKTIDQPLMVETAENIKNQWEGIGIKTEVQLYNRTSLERDVIKPRDYEILLFGVAFEIIPDPFPFWHSSQKNEFGLNLSMYENKDVDSLLEKTRTSLGNEERYLVLKKIEEIILSESPAIFLYNPDYLYFVSPRISGINSGKIINPSNRFANIENWHIKTKRI
jgi:ABC-type transport system substrate-binding protein